MRPLDDHQHLRGLVMDAIANDYEHLTMIVHDVSAWAEEEGVAVTSDQIRLELQDLVRDNLAAAYRLTATYDPPRVVPGIPTTFEMDDDDLYFYLTPTGRLLVTPREAGETT